MTDMINLAQLHMVMSPDVRDWPVTVGITSVSMDPIGGLTLAFDHPPPLSWIFREPGMPAGDNFHYTVWACVLHTYLAGFIEMWQGRPMGDRSLPPLLSGYADWWGDPRQLWGGMSAYVPQPGDTIGLMVSAGNARLRRDVTSVAERSNLVIVTLPADDRGVFTFNGAPAPVPVPVPPTRDEQLQHLIDSVQALALAEEMNTIAVNRLNDQIAGLRQNGIRVHL